MVIVPPIFRPTGAFVGHDATFYTLEIISIGLCIIMIILCIKGILICREIEKIYDDMEEILNEDKPEI